ncbi:type III pantothenate kinase [Flavobacterium amnicola]|uniref:Type III pantothenate kinase n=1 Tax=Flavobacterium amnicola TaxID=2506422 RepID=A0A4V1N258_9FLAO|nr:type III pantothenate kinase [Flavobacterium amnicola]RXR20571.1 type III pantothenate kinase [Flavobacterium amnicola]
MILTIDIGNTQIKSAVFENNTIIHITSFKHELFFNEIENILNQFKKVAVLVVASVGKIDKSAFETFSDKVKIHFIDRQNPFPFTNNYQSPATLGIDRMVLAAGAALQYPNQNKLIIDAGTCVTYDYVDENNIYHGGAISPGIRLRYEAMHNYTAKLPLLKKDELVNLIGSSTEQSMHSGVVNGLAFEIEGYINALTFQKENFIIILTGGDAIFLAKRLKNTIFANSNFLLESLNHLYQYQINND